MGLFSNLMGGKGLRPQPTMQSAFQTGNQVTIPKVNLEKSTETFGKVLVNLSKSSPIDLTKHVARVAMVFDFSGSMKGKFKNGAVQRVTTRVLPIGMRFDDNGEVEGWLFSNGYKRLQSLNIDNYQDYVQEVMLRSGMFMGSTEYAPVLRDVTKYYIEENPSSVPAFVLFITDGDNNGSDKTPTDAIVREISEYNEFVQFVGIGNASFDYLRKLDDLVGRRFDNTGFISVRDMDAMSDEELYTELLRQYITWLQVRASRHFNQ